MEGKRLLRGPQGQDGNAYTGLTPMRVPPHRTRYSYRSRRPTDAKREAGEAKRRVIEAEGQYPTPRAAENQAFT